MVERSGDEQTAATENARIVALTEELGALLGRLKGAGPKITQLLSPLQLGRSPEDDPPPPVVELPVAASVGSKPHCLTAIPLGIPKERTP
jgi:hypothetical protein